PFQLNLERVVGREIVGVEHVQTARILRERDEEKRLSRRPRGHVRGDAADRLDLRAQLGTESADGVLVQLRQEQAADHRRRRLVGLQARIGPQQAVQQRGLSPGLDDFKRVQVAVIEDLYLVDVIRPEQMIAAAADVRDIEYGIVRDFALDIESPLVSLRGLQVRIQDRITRGCKRRWLAEFARLLRGSGEIGEIAQPAASLAERLVD